jgi:cytoskeletal protein CcmA (bactofilin family)
MSIIKKISIPGFLPPATSFGDNEIIINVIDGKLYIKNTQNNTLRVINQDSDKNTPLDGDVLINKKIEFKEKKDSDSILFISSSGKQSRIGVGTTSPESTIDFKSVEDSNIGTELILRTARSSTTGALSGDEGGSINFTIDSGSFNNLKTSGSLAKIKTIVNSVGIGGVQGILALELSKGAGPEGVDVFKYGYQIGGENTFAQIQTGSLIMHDFSSGQPAKINMNDHNSNTTFEVFQGNITASGDISASGTIYANRFHSAQGGEAIDFNDSIDLEGNLTASGNISASGNIYANDLDLAGSIISQQLNIQGSITASGDISASGDLYGNNLNLAGSVLGNSLTLDSSGDAQIILDRGASSNDSEIIFKTNGGEDWSFGTGQIGGDSTLTMRRNSANYFQLDEGGNLELLGNITGSGDLSISGEISASGDMFSKRLKVRDNIPRIALIPSAAPTTEVQFDGTSGNLRIDVDLNDDVNNSTFKVTLDGISNDQLSLNTDGELTLTGGITASGDISCSGDIIGNINGGTF